MPQSAGDTGFCLAKARAGSPPALGQLLETCRAYLLLVARQQLPLDLRAKGGASDLVQETFLEAQRDFGQFHGTTEAELLAWLRRLLLNNLGHFLRHYRDTGKRAVQREVALAADGASESPACGPDAKLLAWRGRDEILHLWELASARPWRWAADPDMEQRHVAGIAFCGGRKQLSFLANNKSAEVRDLTTGELAYAVGPIPLPGQNNWYTGRRLALDPSGTLLAA